MILQRKMSIFKIYSSTTDFTDISFLIHHQKVVLKIGADHFTLCVLSSQVHVCLPFYHYASLGNSMFHELIMGR